MSQLNMWTKLWDWETPKTSGSMNMMHKVLYSLVGMQVDRAHIKIYSTYVDKVFLMTR